MKKIRNIIFIPTFVIFIHTRGEKILTTKDSNGFKGHIDFVAFSKI
jgi:hypothetical protein